ncbi:MAG: hypothetical protein WD448_09410 [Woeseia sp.]
MKEETRLPIALLALRLGVFLVMLVWTADKFVDTDHALRVFESFYFLQGIGPAVMYVVGAVELLIILGFLLGIAKRFTYGAVLLFHGISTLASFPLYLNPMENRMFFAAWPMLAACLALYLLRERDTLWAVSRP